MAKKKEEGVLAGALAESIKSSIHALEVQINLLKQAIGAAPAEEAEEDEEEAPAKGKGKPGRKPAKKAKEEDEEEFDLDEDEEEESDDEDDSDEDEEEESDDDAEEDEESDGGEEELTIEDVTKAFQKFAAKKPANRAKAKKILAKFKVASVRDLKEKDFQKALDMIDGE